MRRHQAVLVALVAAVTLTSVAAAGPGGTKQRVAITAGGAVNATAAGKFVLTPLQSGVLKYDSGATSSLWSDRSVMREGQSVVISKGVDTLEGERGSLAIRFRDETVDGGNGYHPVTGTWKIVRGTGQYARITGAGRRGGVWVGRGPGPERWSWRIEGFLTLP